MTTRGLYQGRPRYSPPAPPRAAVEACAERELVKIRALLARGAELAAARNDLGVATHYGRHSLLWCAYWTDAGGERWSTPRFEREEFAIDEAERMLAGAPGPDVWFVARQRRCSSRALFLACGGPTYVRGVYVAERETAWASLAEPEPQIHAGRMPRPIGASLPDALEGLRTRYVPPAGLLDDSRATPRA